jgi:hypothetical protein
MRRIDDLIETIRARAASLRDPAAAMREILPLALEEAYQDGQSWGRAEGRAQALRGAQQTLETVLGAMRSPEILCPRCDGRSDCEVCKGVGKFPAKPPADPMMWEVKRG